MYKQTCKTEEPILAVRLLLVAGTLVFILLFCGFYDFFSKLLGSNVFPALTLFLLLYGGYAVLRRREAEFQYTLDAITLTIEQKSFGRVVRTLKIPRETLLSLEEGHGKGRKLYPRGSIPYTLSFREEEETSFIFFAPDSTLRSVLFVKKPTDMFLTVHKSELLASLKELIFIPSVKAEPVEGAPFGQACKQALDFTLALCEKWGMEIKNVDGYCGWAQIGSGETLTAVLCHLDVVPAGDGWNTNPFEAVIKKGLLYGRGALDDKGPAIAAVYALASIKDADLSLNGRIRLIFGCDEESDWQCMARYAETEETPTVAFTPDADYPVIIAEKGIAQYRFTTQLEAGDYQLYINGGLRPNMVPSAASAKVIGAIDRLLPVLNAYNCKAQGVRFSADGNVLNITAEGISAHGSTPEKGKNALFALFRFLQALSLGGSQGAFVDTVMHLFVDKIKGEGVSLALSDDVSGALTLNVGMCQVGKTTLYPEMTDDSVSLMIDIRYPVTVPLATVTDALSRAIPAHWDLGVVHQQAPHHISENSPLVETLMHVYLEYTGRDQDQPLAIGGGTYARAFEHAVAFGALFPGQEETAHTANEYISVDSLLLNARIFAAAMLELNR